VTALATKPRACDCGSSGSIGPLSWGDVRNIQDDYGIRPTGTPDAASMEAEVLQALYREWVDRQGISQDRTYVMPLCSLYLLLERDYEYLPRREASRKAQRILVDGLNDPDNGLDLVLLPSRALAPRRKRP